MSPKRIQRKRTKGWRMPEGAIYVGRPSKWGNPAVVGETISAWIGPSRYSVKVEDRAHAADLFRKLLTDRNVHMDDWGLETGWQERLRGHDLACWCPIDQPCHADVLIELANGDD